MKKLLLMTAFGLLFSLKAEAAPLVAEAPINGYGTPETVAISSTTLTKVPTSQTSGRLGIFIDNPSTNTSSMVGFMGNCTSTALASTIRPLVFSPAADSAFIGIREDVCLWLLSLDTGEASENVHVQEAKQ